MGLITLSADIPWLSLIWLSMLVPAIIIAFIPDRYPDLMRWVGTGFALISLILSLLVFLAYDPVSVCRVSRLDTAAWDQLPVRGGRHQSADAAPQRYRDLYRCPDELEY